MLVRDPGPDIRKLSRAEAGGLHTIMHLALVPESWTLDAKAAAVLTLIHECIDGLKNPRWRAAAEAAFRVPADQYVSAEFDSLASRFRSVARGEATTEEHIKARSEDYRGYWVTAAKHLADLVEHRLAELNRTPEHWNSYRTDEPPSPPRSLPISFDRTDVLYRFSGRRGVQSISYRWLTAHGAVNHYDAVGWYYNEPDAPVEITPLANCVRKEPLVDLPEGGRLARLEFTRVLDPGDRYFFAYITAFNSDQPCRPTILYEVRGLSMKSLTIRIQFDAAECPVRVWYFDVGMQGEGHKVPLDGAAEILEVAPNGYVDHEFPQCERGRKYGIRWLWENPSPSATIKS